MGLLLLWLSLAARCELVVAAASDLAPLEKPLGAGFEKVTGCRVRWSFGSSGMLARQIENGAPFDVYLSADKRFVDGLVARGKLDRASVARYAFGRLGLWSKRGWRWDDLGNPRLRHISLANPEHAPYGRAAREALESQGVWSAIAGKIVYGENVRQAFQFAESGNADAAIVAWALVKDRGGQLLDPSWHRPLEQTGGVVAGSRNAAMARRFLEFLQSSAGRTILRAHGLDVD